MALGAINNLDYVILLCERMATTREFYLNVMKFALEMDRPDWVSFRVGSGLLTLRPRGQRASWHDGPQRISRTGDTGRSSSVIRREISSRSTRKFRSRTSLPKAQGA